MRIRGFNQKMESDNAFMEKWIRSVKNINKFYTIEQAEGLGPKLAAYKDNLIKKLVKIKHGKTKIKYADLDIEKTDQENGDLDEDGYGSDGEMGVQMVDFATTNDPQDDQDDRSDNDEDSDFTNQRSGEIDPETGEENAFDSFANKLFFERRML